VARIHVVGLLLLLWSKSLGAGGNPARPLSLGWVRREGANTCINPRSLAVSVEQILGRSVFVSAAQAQASIEGSIERQHGAPGWKAVLVMTNGQGDIEGRRELSTKDATCTSLNETLSLALALMIDPDVALRSADTKPAPSPPKVIAAPEEPPCVQTPSPWRWGASVGAILGVGWLPATLTPGLAVRGFVRPPHLWAFELSAVLWPSRRARGISDQAVDLSLAFGGLAVCPLAIGAEKNNVQWRGCVGGQLGTFEAVGANLDVIQQQRRTVVNAVTYLDTFVPLLSSVGLVGTVGIGTPLLRDSFVYVDENGSRQQLFRLPAVTAWAELGVGVAF